MLVVGISPTLNVGRAGPVTQRLNEVRFVYIPSLSSDNNGETEFGVARNGVDGGLAIVGQPGGCPIDGGVCRNIRTISMWGRSRYAHIFTHELAGLLEMGRTC